MASSCNAQRLALIECLADSECIREGRTPKDCMEIDADCKALRGVYAACKRGQLDMRKRIKGNMAAESLTTRGDPESTEAMSHNSD